MPKSIIAEGKTTNEAVENGLKELKVSKNQVEIKVLDSDDKRSFFSILAPRVVKVELTLKDENSISKNSSDVETNNKEEKHYLPEELERAEKNVKEFLDVFLKQIGQNITYNITKKEIGLEVSINGEESGFLIGYRGDTLYSLQSVISSIASKGNNYRVRVILDIEDYKAKREKTLEDLAERMAKKAIRTKKEVVLEPMKAYERKIIHSKLQNSDKVTTRSVGEEPNRRLIISLK